MKKCISLIIPIFNEEKNIPILYAELKKVIAQLSQQYRFEFIFIDDGSKDTSWNNITSLAKQDSDVKGIKFSRNFGQQAALTAGYDYVSGDAVISMDADMQDPPSLLIPMVEQWEKGFDIVYARRANRDDSFLKKITAYCYYWVLTSVADISIPRNVGDFRLIDKKVRNNIKQCREQSRYMRGMIAWVGFKHVFIDFDRPARYAGRTAYTWKKMFNLAADGMTSFSYFPLKIAAYIGWLIIISGWAILLYFIIMGLFFRAYYSLFTWFAVVIYIVLGIQCLLIWLLGEYVGRTYGQVKQRPLYITEETIEKE